MGLRRAYLIPAEDLRAFVVKLSKYSKLATPA
jgi:hypothetical protein